MKYALGILRYALQSYGRPIVGLMISAFVLTMASPSWARTLVIGTISNHPVDEIRAFKPFANFLAKQLARDGIDTVKVVVATDIVEMANMLKRKQADLYIDSSMVALAVNKLSGSKYMLRRWKKGRDKYRSVIFVLEDGGITSIDGLKGNVIAFEEPFSTSGFIMPALILRRKGMEIFSLKNFRARPSPHQIGYVMALDNEAQVFLLERGHVQAAAMAEKDFESFKKSAIKPFRLLHVTPYIPYHVVVNRPGLDATLVDRLKIVLKAAHKTEQGRGVLEGFERTTKFDEIPKELLDEVIKLAPYLNTIISTE